MTTRISITVLLALLMAVAFPGRIVFAGEPDGLLCRARSARGTLDFTASIGALESVGDTVFAVAFGTFQSFSVADPDTPTVIGEISTPGSSSGGLLIDGNFAYSVGNRFDIFDITDPTQPNYLSGTSIAGQGSVTADAITVGDGYATVIERERILIFDITDPTLPFIAASHESGVFIRAAGSDQNTVVLATGVSDFTVVDISDPLAPVLAGEFIADAIIFAKKIFVRGDLIYVVDSRSIVIYDISDPMNPIELSDTAFDSFYRGGAKLEGDLMYVSVQSAVKVFDVSDPEAPVELGAFELSEDPKSIAITPSQIVVTSGPFSRLVRVFDLDGYSPFPLQVEGDSVTGPIRRISVTGTGVYAAALDAGIYRVAFGPDGEPTFPQNMDTPGQARHVVSHDDLLLVADGTAGLTILDGPTGEVLVTLDTPSDARALSTFGDFVVIADALNSLRVVDIADPMTPHEVGVFSFDGVAVDTAVLNGRVLLLDVFGQLIILDVSDPTAPVSTVTLQLDGFATQLVCFGNTAFIAGTDMDGQAGMVTAVDMTDPDQPVLRSEFFRANPITGIGMYRGMLVTLDTDLLTILDVNDLAALEILAEYDHDRFSGVLAIADDTAVVTSRLTLGSTSSTAATIQLADCSPCPADISGDGLLDLTDLNAFIAAFIGGDLDADFAAEFGVLDLGDIIAFVQLFVAGCGS